MDAQQAQEEKANENNDEEEQEKEGEGEDGKKSKASNKRSLLFHIWTLLWFLITMRIDRTEIVTVVCVYVFFQEACQARQGIHRTFPCIARRHRKAIQVSMDTYM